MAPRKLRQAKPIREVITNPNVRVTPRSAASAAHLAQTIKGRGDGGSGPGGVYIPGVSGTSVNEYGNVVHNADIGNSNIRTGATPPSVPVVTPISPKPLRRIPTPEEALAAYAVKLNGNQPVTEASMAKWSQSQIADYNYAKLSLDVNSSLSGFPERLNAYVNAVKNNIETLGENGPSAVGVHPTGIGVLDQMATGFVRMYDVVADPIRTQDAPRTTGDHAKTQAAVGGTPGSATVVDRSAANKKAWITRRQLYGDSGRTKD